MNAIWLGMLLVSFAAAALKATLYGDFTYFTAIITSMFDSATLAVQIAITLIGTLCLWLGLLKIADAAGIVDRIARFLTPVLNCLMPEIPPNHPALGSISINIAANMLGLDNAATPAGIKAMEQLQTLNKSADTASNAQIMFLVINTSSVTLLPVTIMLYRAQAGSHDPAMVLAPILLATACSTLAGIALTAWIQKIKLAQKPLIAFGAVLAAAIATLITVLYSAPPELRRVISSEIGNVSMASVICYFLIMAWRKSVPVYEFFIEGAKEGFATAVRIIPYLVAMLVAVGVLKASGIFELALTGFQHLFSMLGVDTSFVPALPVALIKPFSGSAARALMIDTMHSYGADSFPALVAAVIQGSTETTFYVLSVYFGAVGIKRIRHAAGCGLAADLAGVIASIFICYAMFNHF